MDESFISLLRDQNSDQKRLMCGAEGIAYIQSRAALGSRLGLYRTRELLERLSNPQKSLRFVHVAGTNGKGSTSAMLSSILTAAGYRTGLFTSPFLVSIHEQMSIGGSMISDDELGALVTELKTAAETMEDPPSEFELITSLAFLYFARNHCDIVVLEVGMGGATDSTNVIDVPEAAVITAIGMDHMSFLGATVEKIAKVKAGIIKDGGEIVLYPQLPSVHKVIAEICDQRDAKLIPVEVSRAVILNHSLNGQAFSWDGVEFFLPLLGKHQINNAAAALTTVQVLRQRGWSIREEAVRQGLKGTNWPARFEVLRREPLFILDGGHNPQCVSALVQNIMDDLPDEKLTLLVGVLADKDYDAMFRQVIPFANSFVTVTPQNPRALSAEALAQYLRPYGKPVTACETIEDGMSAAMNQAGKTGTVCAFGSLYMAGEIRKQFG